MGYLYSLFLPVHRYRGLTIPKKTEAAANPKTKTKANLAHEGIEHNIFL